MTLSNSILLHSIGITPALLSIEAKVMAGERISPEDGILLFREAPIPFLSVLAEAVSTRINENRVFFNRNFHIEPTNICVNHCAFCSYRRRKGEEGCWELSIEEMRDQVLSRKKSGATEVHIVGGVHPDRDIYFYAELIKTVKECAPDLHIKAFTAVEVDMMCRQGGLSIEKGLMLLKEAGLNSMPGGGAEIFDETIRQKICPDKTSSSEWLRIHQIAHQLGIPTNATMLYGLLEGPEHRIDHMERLRKLQSQTHGFNVFIPLKFRHYNNSFSHIHESSTVEDLRNYAVSRIYLDNIPHLKAYWPMIGKEVSQVALAFGVDDLDGTIDDTTKIYSMAGAAEKNPTASTDELIMMIKSAGKIPAERDTLFNIIKI